MKFKTNHPRFQHLLATAMAAGTLSGYAAVESDLVCAYAPSTAAAWGGEANARVTMANQVIGSDALNDQSGTGQHLNIVGYVMSSRDSVGEDNGYVLGLVAGDGAYSDVRNYAASVGADQVVYVPYASTGAAGNAYQPGTYSAVNSTWWWLVVVAHETGGHNYGLDHGDGHLNPKTIMLHNYCGGGAAWPYLYSNPNIWDGGVNMLGDGAATCTGSSVNGGDSAFGISTRCQSMCDTTLRVVYPPVLTNTVLHWCFTNAPGAAPASTTNYDLVSGAPAVVRGNGATYTGSALRLPGGTTGNVAMNSMAAYIDLPNGILSSQTNITIEIWATPQSAPNWARILDFGNSSAGELAGNPGDAAPGATSQTDGITLTADNGTDLTQQRFEAKRNGSTYTVNSSLATTAGVQHHYAVTFADGAGAYGTKKSASVDGAADVLTTDQWSGPGTGGQFWIGGSADTGDGTANLNGLVDEVYVFNRPLSATEIQSLYNNNTLANNDSVVHLSFDNVSGGTVNNDGTGGAAMNGTLNGSATVVSGGMFGNCLSIAGADASSSSCRIASSVVPLTVGSGSSWTVAMWVKSSTAGGCYAYQGDGGWASGNTTLYFNQGNATAGTHAGGVRYAQGWETGTAAVNDGTWHQVVLSCNSTNGGRWQWYRDGFAVGLLDVSNRLANITDVNEWLGRSEYSGDSLANSDYSEVRISNVAMNQPQVMANYLLGPNYTPRSAMLAASDQWGGTRSFNVAGNWSDGLTPSAGKSYEMADLNLITPNTASPYTFAGASLHASGGIFFDGASGSSTITVNNFQIDNEEICNGTSVGGSTFTLAGNLYVTNNNIVRGSTGPITLAANLNGKGSITFYGKNGVGGYNASLTGNNANFTGKIRVGNGIPAGLNLTSEAQLGANPPSFTADQLIFNRGWLYTTTSFTISNSNRGITIGANDGIFDVAAGTTLTLGCPLASGYQSVSGNQLVTVGQVSGVVAGVLVKQNSGTLALTSSNANYNGAIEIGAGTLSILNAGQLGGGAFGNSFKDNGVFNYASSASQTISSAITGTGAITKSGSGTLTLSGANTFSGATTVSGGTLLVNGSSTGGGAVTVASGGTLGGSGSVAGAVTVQSGGTINPGTGIGTFTANGNVTLQAGSTNFMELNKTSASSDKLVVGGTLMLGGTLQVVNLSGTLAYGDTFTLFQSGTISGNFSGYSLPALASGLKWVTNAITTGILSVGSTSDVPPVAPAGLVTTWTTNNQARLVWNPAYAATTYNIKRSTVSGGSYVTIATGVTNTMFYSGALTPGVTYYYVVSASNPFGESGNSAQATAVGRVTKAYWNFQEGTADAYVPYAPATAGQYDGSIHDVSGSGDPLSAWSTSWEWYRAQVPAAATPQTGAANTLSVQNANSYPAMSAIGTSLTTWNPSQWTIEAAIRPDSVTSGYQTFVGRDSQGAYSGNTALAALYFSITPGGNLRVIFTDSAGNNWELDSAANAVQAVKWQAVAATSDGKTLALYLKNVTDGAASYTLLGTLDISASANPALSTGTGSGSDWSAGVISVGRGLYNGGHTDRFFGYLDDIRLTAGALNPAAFLYSSPPVFPAAPAVLAVSVVTNNQINLSWAASSGTTGYYIKRSTTSGSGYTIVGNCGGTTFTDTGLMNGTMYYYTVSAINAVGEGANSVQAAARAVSVAPANLGLGSFPGNQFSLSWPADHTGWRLLMNTDLAGTNWLDVSSNVVMNTNQIALPINATNHSVFYRLVYP